MAGMHRTADVLCHILASIEAGLRDRALLLLVGFAGALRRVEPAAIRAEHLERCEHLILPHSKGATGRGVTVVSPMTAPSSTRSALVRTYQWTDHEGKELKELLI